VPVAAPGAAIQWLLECQTPKQYSDAIHTAQAQRLGRGKSRFARVRRPQRKDRGHLNSSTKCEYYKQTRMDLGQVPSLSHAHPFIPGGIDK